MARSCLRVQDSRREVLTITSACHSWWWSSLRKQLVSCSSPEAATPCDRTRDCLDKLLLPLGLCGAPPAECGVCQRLSLSGSSSAASALEPAARQLRLGVVPQWSVGTSRRVSLCTDRPVSREARGAISLLSWLLFAVCVSTPPGWSLRAPPASNLPAGSNAALSPPLQLPSPNGTARASSKHAKHGPPHSLNPQSTVLYTSSLF